MDAMAVAISIKYSVCQNAHITFYSELLMYRETILRRSHSGTGDIEQETDIGYSNQNDATVRLFIHSSTRQMLMR